MEYHRELVCLTETEKQIMIAFRQLETYKLKTMTDNKKEQVAYALLVDNTIEKINILLDNLKDHCDALRSKVS